MRFIFHSWGPCLWSLVLDIHQHSGCGGNKWLCCCREEIVRRKKTNTRNLIVALWPGLPEKKAVHKATVENSQAHTCCAEPPHWPAPFPSHAARQPFVTRKARHCLTAQLQRVCQSFGARRDSDQGNLPPEKPPQIRIKQLPMLHVGGTLNKRSSLEENPFQFCFLGNASKLW